VLVVIAHVSAKRGTQDEVREVLSSLVKPSRTHDGCVQYDVHVDPDDDCHFVFYERWESKEKLDQHLANAAFGELTKPLERLAPDTDLRFFDLIS
jgi:quinol monooxygenase YgiN